MDRFCNIPVWFHLPFQAAPEMKGSQSLHFLRWTPDNPSEMVVLDAADGSVIDMLNVAMKISAD